MDYLERYRKPGSAEPAYTGLTTELTADEAGRRGLPPSIVPIGVVLILVIAWQTAAMSGLIDTLLFPAPTTIARATWESILDGSLPAAIGATAIRILWAVALGGLTGMAIGIAMGMSERVRKALDPFVGALHSLPKIAVLPLLMAILGIGELPLIVIIAAGVFFPMLINTMSGVSQIDPTHLDVAKLHRASRSLIIRRVVTPAAAPSVLAGLRLSLNIALLMAIAVEMLAAGSGLGEMIWMSWATFRVEDIYVAVLVTIVFGLAVNGLISLLTRIWVPWQQVGRR